MAQNKIFPAHRMDTVGLISPSLYIKSPPRKSLEISNLCAMFVHFPSSERATTKVVPPPSTPTSLIFVFLVLCVFFIFLSLLSRRAAYFYYRNFLPFLFCGGREGGGMGERGVEKGRRRQTFLTTRRGREFSFEDKKIEGKAPL